MKLHAERCDRRSTAAENRPPYSQHATVVSVTGARNECVKYTNDPDGTPRNSREDESTSSWFHPTCGDFTLAGKRSHSPSNKPSPPRLRRFLTAAQTSIACRRRSPGTEFRLRSHPQSHPSNRSAPEPLSRQNDPRREARFSSPSPHPPESAVMAHSCPSQSNAFFTETKFPAP